MKSTECLPHLASFLRVSGAAAAQGLYPPTRGNTTLPRRICFLSLACLLLAAFPAAAMIVTASPEPPPPAEVFLGFDSAVYAGGYLCSHGSATAVDLGQTFAVSSPVTLEKITLKVRAETDVRGELVTLFLGTFTDPDDHGMNEILAAETRGLPSTLAVGEILYLTFDIQDFPLDADRQYGFVLGFSGGGNVNNARLEILHLGEDAYPGGQAVSVEGAFTSALEHDLVFFLRTEPQPAAGTLSAMADLIVPGFEVDATGPQGPTTLFAVRNTSDSNLDVDVAYYGMQTTSPAQRTDVVELGPQQTATVNVCHDLTDLVVTGGFASGLILITEAGGSTGNLEGDYFRLDQANAFATGDRLVRPEDFCRRREIRFVDFGSGSELRILVDNPQGAEEPSLTWTGYNERGDLVGDGELFTSDHLTLIAVADLGIPGRFGTVLFDFSSSGGGWVSARHSAFGLFSVELGSACRED